MSSKNVTCIFSYNKQVVQAWWQASRPPFYIATLVPVLLGYIVAGHDKGHWDYIGLGGILFICLLQHLAANLANDLFDHLLGVDSAETIGGSRVIQEGKISPRALAVALVLLYSATLLCTFVGVRYFSLPSLWLVSFFAMFSSFFYVAPPIRYGHRALGEVFVFLNMGLAMTVGTYYAFTGTVTLQILGLAIPVGLMVAGILYYQSLPEMDVDKASGKHTLANVLGQKWAFRLFYCWWPCIWCLLLCLWLLGYTHWFVLVGIFTSLPFYRTIVQLVRQAHSQLELDGYGSYVRRMYLLCGIALLVSVGF